MVLRQLRRDGINPCLSAVHLANAQQAALELAQRMTLMIGRNGMKQKFNSNLKVWER